MMMFVSRLQAYLRFVRGLFRFIEVCVVWGKNFAKYVWTPDVEASVWSTEGMPEGTVTGPTGAGILLGAGAAGVAPSPS